MGRMKLGVAMAGVILTLGVAGCGSDRAGTVADKAPVTTLVPGASSVSPTVPPATGQATTPVGPAATQTGPAAALPGLTIPQPSVHDIQNVIAQITAQVQAPTAATGGTAPLTKEQVEAAVRERLKQLGITY
jgi:hypothetical protein